MRAIILFVPVILLWSLFFLPVGKCQAQNSSNHYFEGTIYFVSVDDALGITPSPGKIWKYSQYVFDEGNMLQRDSLVNQQMLLDYGIIRGDYVLIGDTGYYEVSHSEEAYRQIENPISRQGYGYFESSPRLIEATQDSMVILGYTCRKYIIRDVSRVLDVGDSVIKFCWIASEIRIENYMEKARFLDHRNNLPPEINAGFPLRIDYFMENEEGEIPYKFSFMATKVEPGKVEPIEVPAGYREGSWDGRP